MTQPFDIPTAANAFSPAEFTPAPPPSAAAQPATPATPGDERAARLKAEFDNETAGNARLTALRERQGIGQTTGDQFFRGVFDAILYPGALLGAGAESAGSALGIEALRDFGRDLGKASSGAAAADLISELGGNAAGAVRRDLAGQDEARPLLSTIARGSGMVGVGVAASAGLTGAGVRGLAATGAVEGAGAGAQTAYEHNAPLQDVLATAALGGILGGAGPLGIAGAQQGVKYAARKFAGAELGDTLKDAMGKFATERGAKALGFNPSTIKRLGRDAPAAEREMKQVVEDVMAHKLDDGTPVFQATQSQDDLAGRIQLGREELGAKLGALRNEVSDFVESKAPELMPSPALLASRIESEIIAPLASSKVPGVQARAADVQAFADSLRSMGPATSLRNLRKVQEDLASEVYPRSPTGQLMPPVKDIRGLFEADRLIENAVADIMDKASDRMGAQTTYRNLKRLDQSFIKAAKVSGAEQLADIGRRAFSLSDTLAGVAAFGGDIATGGATSVLKGIAAAGMHKLLRERSSSVPAVLFARLARTPKPAFSVAAVGGREAQEALENLAQVRNFVRETGEAVSDNPNVRRVAEVEARETAQEALAKRAGDFDPARWAERSPTPLQKVFYRKQILDATAQDMATTATRVGSYFERRPGLIDAEYIRDGMRDLKEFRRYYAGKSPEEANAIAVTLDPPVKVTIDPSQTYLADGRHRMTAAAEAGATHIRAFVREFDANGDLVNEGVRVLPIQSKSPVPKELDPARLKKLMKDADGGIAIGALQNRMAELADGAPPTAEAADVALELRKAAAALETAELPEAFAAAHRLRQQVERLGDYGQVVAERLRSDMVTEQMGEAGALYAALTHPGGAHQKLADPVALREALRTADQRGVLPAALHDANEAILAAAQARARLTGEKLPPGLERSLREAEELFAAGEEAATLDGRSMSRIFEHLDEGAKGPDPQKAVWDAVAPEIDKLVPVIKQAAGESKRGRYRPTLGRVAADELAEQRFQLPEEQRIEYDQRLDKVAEVLSDPRRVEESGADAQTAPVVTSKLAQFLEDVPKPRQDIRGKAFETMSSNDLRLAAAMYEATVKPLSVLADFRSGVVDYDKVQYAWKQWPGLQVAVQAGILDVLQQDLDDDEREGLSDTMLTQLDFLAGFGGRLQASLDPAFSARIDTLNVPPEPAKPPSGGGALSSPKAEPTFTQRVAGAQA